MNKEQSKRFVISDKDPRDVRNTHTGQVAGFMSADAARTTLEMLLSGQTDASSYSWMDER